MAVAWWASRFATSIHWKLPVICAQSQRNYALGNEITVARRKDSFVVESDAVKDKRLFLDLIERFKVGNPSLRGHVEFLTIALKHVEEFQVHRDLSVYKTLFHLFPKGKLRPKNLIQAAFYHNPRHQDLGLEFLRVMGEHGVMPDREFRQIVLLAFGPESDVFKKFCRMMYWMPKFANASPYPLPRDLPTDPKELALLGIKKITGVDPATEIEVFDCKDLKESCDKTWIVSGQSWKQRELLLGEKGKTPLRIEGPFTLWMAPRALQYFTLLGERRIKPEVSINTDEVSNLKLKYLGENIEPSQDIANLPCVHEQKGETIFACCASGTSSRDSMLSWLRFLQIKNPILKDLPTVFKLKAPTDALENVDVPNRSRDFDDFGEAAR